MSDHDNATDDGMAQAPATATVRISQSDRGTESFVFGTLVVTHEDTEVPSTALEDLLQAAVVAGVRLEAKE